MGLERRSENLDTYVYVIHFFRKHGKACEAHRIIISANMSFSWEKSQF